MGVCRRGTNEVQQSEVNNYESQRSITKAMELDAITQGELAYKEGGIGTDEVTFTGKEKVIEEAIGEEAGGS